MTSLEEQSKNGNVDPRNKLNDLDSKEWIVSTISVWTQKGLGAGHPDAQIERQHPAPFSFTDISRLILFFTKEDEVVLDPFVGIGSTLKACALERRQGIGFELNPQYVELTQKRLTKEVDDDDSSYTDKQQVLTGDARELAKQLEPESVDFLVTSPPYWNILHKKDHKANQERISQDLDTQYSDSALDLGNIDDYETFLDDLVQIFTDCCHALKPKKYAAIIVSDFREKSQYVMFHADLANRLEDVGFQLKGIKILYQRHKRIFPYGYPYSYVPNIHHQYILILQKDGK